MLARLLRSSADGLNNEPTLLKTNYEFGIILPKCELFRNEVSSTGCSRLSPHIYL